MEFGLTSVRSCRYPGSGGKVFYLACGALGPLLWHWENNNTNDPSIELDLEEVKNLARAIGFELSVSFSLSPLNSRSPDHGTRQC